VTATGKRWQLRGRFPDGELDGLQHQPLIRHLLWHRGVRTLSDANAFLDNARPDYDPLLLPDMEAALHRLRRAIHDGELIAVYGDFDVDGVTATAILTEGLCGLGGRVVPYIPDRFSEGYGVNNGALQSLREQAAGLVVTADCGTSSVAEVAFARKVGMDVIIVDHHSIPRELPVATAIVNPRRPESRYPDPELAAGGLAFKLMAALHELLQRPWQPERYLDLVALSTVCDMAPLQGENRWLVKQGLAVLSRTQRPGLRALMEASGIDPSHVDEGSIGYGLGPRLNAAGRLAHARLALDLLMEEDEERATQRALELTDLNTRRQQATAAALELAHRMLMDDDSAAGGPLIFVGHADMPPGIVGLVAGRLAEEHYRPAVVYERGEATSRASCRSIPEFDITGALRNHAELMVRFGGHRAAAGFTAENENLPALKEALTARAGDELAHVELVPVIDIDAAIPLHRVNGKLIQSLACLAPFGQGNPEPVFLSRDLEVADVRAVGDDGRHLRLRLKDGRANWPAIAFGLGDHGVQPGQRLDVVYTFGGDRNSNGGMELRVKDVAAAAPETPLADGARPRRERSVP
jgi:single-stranded-DNA-specific exonuclease